MTINDMINAGIDFQGRTEIRHWSDREETYDLVVETEDGICAGDNTNNVFDMEIAYVYCVDNKLIIEVKEKEEY